MDPNDVNYSANSDSRELNEDALLDNNYLAVDSMELNEDNYLANSNSRELNSASQADTALTTVDIIEDEAIVITSEDEAKVPNPRPKKPPKPKPKRLSGAQRRRLGKLCAIERGEPIRSRRKGTPRIPKPRNPVGTGTFGDRSRNAPPKTSVTTFSRDRSPRAPSARFSRDRSPRGSSARFFRDRSPRAPSFSDDRSFNAPSVRFSRDRSPYAPSARFSRDWSPPSASFSRDRSPPAPPARFSRDWSPPSPNFSRDRSPPAPSARFSRDRSPRAPHASTVTSFSRDRSPHAPSFLDDRSFHAPPALFSRDRSPHAPHVSTVTSFLRDRSPHDDRSFYIPPSCSRDWSPPAHSFPDDGSFHAPPSFSRDRSPPAHSFPDDRSFHAPPSFSRDSPPAHSFPDDTSFQAPPSFSRDRSPHALPVNDVTSFSNITSSHAPYECAGRNETAPLSLIRRKAILSAQSRFKQIRSDTSSDTQTVIKVVVCPRDFPETRLTKDQFNQFQMALLDAIQPGADGSGPAFNACRLQRGTAALMCKDQATADWVCDVVPNLELWAGASLRIGNANDVLSINKTKVVMYAPKALNQKSASEILKLIKTQNNGLRTEDWYIINHKAHDKGVSIVFSIDEPSLKHLRNSGMKACLGLSKATFKVLKIQNKRPTNQPATQ